MAECPVNTNSMNKMAGTYRSNLTKADLIATATVVCTAGQFTRLGEYRVLAGDLVAMGFGECECQDSAIGRLYAIMNTAPATPTDGVIRISTMTANDRPYSIVFEARTEITSMSVALRNGQLPMPMDQLWLSQDKRFELSFNPDTTSTITKADSIVLVDVTKEDV